MTPHSCAGQDSIRTDGCQPSTFSFGHTGHLDMSSGTLRAADQAESLVQSGLIVAKVVRHCVELGFRVALFATAPQKILPGLLCMQCPSSSF